VILRGLFAEVAVTDQERARWTKLVADFESSDLTQREFATERGISFSNLRNWIYRLRKESRPLVAIETKEPGQSPEQGEAKRASRLVPVRVIASAPKARRPAAAVPAGDGLLELALPSGVRVRFPAGTDLAYLRALAAAL
jgi:transposase-like protein